ncbi:MAG: hypothetical protein JOZ08_16320 [Verrucomicrobia bacterium]|nr:hypothetical protein [Verrucomicrobiota bacterium]
MTNPDVHAEGPVARSLEQQTAKLPSDLFLWAAVGSILASLILKATPSSPALRSQLGNDRGRIRQSGWDAVNSFFGGCRTLSRRSRDSEDSGTVIGFASGHQPECWAERKEDWPARWDRGATKPLPRGPFW